MTSAELSQYRYQSGSILLGRDDDGQMIGVDDDRHLMTVAGSRAGKSSTCLKPNLMLWPSSVMCIDPKGELAMDTAMHRAQMGQDVYILDPFGEVKGEAAKFRVGYNPLAEILAGDAKSVIDDATMIADALIVPNKGGQDHWSLSAKNLLRGLILWVLRSSVEPQNLNSVRRWITSPMGDDDEVDDQTIWLSTLFELMGGCDDFSGVLAGVGNTMKGKPRGERGSIISTAVEQTSFLDSEEMQEHLAQDGLDTLRVLKRKPSTIYLVLPASRMGTHYRWLRVILTLALSSLEREPMRLEKPVLFILEEFPQLGYMRQIEAAAGLMAGYGVKLWTVLQDLSQIKALYRDSWETFIGNAGVVQSFGNTDATTLEYISRSLGNLHIKEQQENRLTATALSSGAKSSSDNVRGVPLLAPFEVAQYCARETQKQIIRYAGKPPAYINRMSHKEVADL
jgi:type IV secretion system protein VirD4